MRPGLTYNLRPDTICLAALAASALFDPDAVRRQLQQEAERVASRFAPARFARPPAWAQRADPPLATLAVLADPHVDDSGKAAWTAPLRDRLLRAIRFLNDAVKPQAVLLLGDLVAFEDAEQLRRVKALLDANLAAPYHAVPGNHDGPGYERVFGPRNHAFAVAGVRFIAIGITYWHWDSGWGNYDEMDWLAGQFAAHRGEPTIVLSHNPIALPTFANNAAVLRLLDAQPAVLAVLAGHMHVDYEVRLAKVHLGMPMLARAPYAFKVLRVHPDCILVLTFEEAGGAYRQGAIYQKIDIPPGLAPRRAAAPAP